MLKLLNWENQCHFLSLSVTNGRVKLPPTSPFSPFPLNMTTLEAVRDSYLQSWQQNLVYWSQRCRLEPGPGSESDWIPLTPWGPWACWVSSGLAHLLSCTSYAALPSFFFLAVLLGGRGPGSPAGHWTQAPAGEVQPQPLCPQGLQPFLLLGLCVCHPHTHQVTQVSFRTSVSAFHCKSDRGTFGEDLIQREQRPRTAIALLLWSFCAFRYFLFFPLCIVFFYSMFNFVTSVYIISTFSWH